LFSCFSGRDCIEISFWEVGIVVFAQVQGRLLSLIVGGCQ